MTHQYTIHAPGEYDAQAGDLYRVKVDGQKYGSIREFTAAMPKADMAAARGLILEHWRLDRGQ